MPNRRKAPEGVKRDGGGLGEFSPLEADLLVQSELLIEKQQDRIHALKDRLLTIESLKSAEHDALRVDIKNLKEANAKLR